MKNIYFAAPMFAESDRLYNEMVVEKIRTAYPNVRVYLPQENGDINDKTSYANSVMIAKADTDEVLKSDLMIAVLDGISIDAGVASEIGVAYAKEIPVIGVYTDSRQQGGDNVDKIAALNEVAENQFHYLNLYTTGLIKLNGLIISSQSSLLEEISKRL